MSGEFIVLKDGSIGINASGGGIKVFTDDKHKCDCCGPCEVTPRKHRILHAWQNYTSNSEDLTPYKKMGGKYPYWCLSGPRGGISWTVEGGLKIGEHEIYGNGSVNNGELTGLMDFWEPYTPATDTITLFVYCENCNRPCDTAPADHIFLHRWTSNKNFGPEDLTPYKYSGGNFKYWRLSEGTARWEEDGCFKSSLGVVYDSGSIVDGELIGLADSWTSMYSYNGYMNLYIFCC